MPTDREIAEAARDIHRPADPSLGAYAAFMDRFDPGRVLALLNVADTASAFELTQEWGPVSDALDALDRSSE